MRRSRYLIAFSASVIGVFVAEALAADDSPLPRHLQARLLKRYPQIDANRNGTLARAEVQKFFHDRHAAEHSKFAKPGGTSDKRPNRGPGKSASRGPDPAELLKNHPELDTDHDGKLSREERKATREQFDKRIMKQFPDAD